MEFIRRRREDLRPTATDERVIKEAIENPQQDHNQPQPHHHIPQENIRPPANQLYSENPKYDYSAVRPLRP